MVRAEEDHLAAVRVRSENEHLGDEGSDALRREVDDAHDLPPDQLVEYVAVRDLGARALLAEGAQVDPELVRGLASLRKGLRPQDGADPHVHPLEVAPADLAHGIWGS